MAKSFKTLREKMSPEARERSRRKAEKLIEEMPLNELRAARKMTQEKLAENLHVKQAAVSKLERRADMYVSTLREFISAMGGELEITARFPDGSVRINQFEDRRWHLDLRCATDLFGHRHLAFDDLRWLADATVHRRLHTAAGCIVHGAFRDEEQHAVTKWNNYANE